MFSVLVKHVFLFIFLAQHRKQSVLYLRIIVYTESDLAYVSDIYGVENIVHISAPFQPYHV